MVAGRLLVFDEELPSRSDRSAGRARIPEAEVLGPAELPPAGRCTSGGLLQPCEQMLSIAQCHDSWLWCADCQGRHLKTISVERFFWGGGRQCGRRTSGQDPESLGELLKSFGYLMCLDHTASTKTFGTDTLDVKSRTVESLVADRLPCRFYCTTCLGPHAPLLFFLIQKCREEEQKWKIPRHGTIRIFGSTRAL